MNRSMSGSDRALDDLISKLLDGSISASEHAELQAKMRHDPLAQQKYFDHLDLDSDLHQLSFDVSDPSHPQAHSDRSNVSAYMAAGVVMLALAASLLVIGLFLPNWNRESFSQKSITNEAVLVQSAGAQFFREVVPAVGESLEAKHEYALIRGLIELRFANGAEVILEAPAVMEVVDADRLVIKQGSCSVHAPPGAEGFQVLTPHTEVTDLGTRFSVSVSEDGDTEVHVVEGAAEVRGRDESDSDKLLLREREASRFDGEGLSEIAYESTLFRNRLPDRVISFEVGNSAGVSNGRLQSVSVQRGGIRYDYKAEDLIGIEVIHFRAGANPNNLSVPVGDARDDIASRRSPLETDVLLHTGYLNPGGSRLLLASDPVIAPRNGDDSTPGMAVRFHQPIVNVMGPDVVFFEVQSAVNPADGDAFHVSPLRFDAGLHSIAIKRYDITLNAAEALPVPKFELRKYDLPVTSIDRLLDGGFKQTQPALDFFAIATGIDLSDLGYPDGAAVEGLFFQDAEDDGGHQVDPVFIGGLPPSKEKPE